MNTFANPSKLKFVLVRAGSTDLDNQGRILGSLDLPLSQTGEQEVRATADELGELEIAAIYSSAGLAARQTASQLSRDGAIKVRVDEKLTNLDHGLWHGKSLDELKETQPKLYRQWKEQPQAVHPPEGETVEAVRKRVANLLKKIHKKFKSGIVVIVAPDPLLSIIRCEVESKPFPNQANEPTKCGGWNLVEVAGVVV
jgi:broad specificity phosphatase PhoE